MPGTRYPNAEGHPPPAPLQRGEERSEALGKQATSQRRAESLNEYGFGYRTIIIRIKYLLTNLKH